MRTEWIEWLERGLEQPGKNKSGLARALQVDPSAITMLMKGKRRLQLGEMEVAARYFGIPMPMAPRASHDPNAPEDAMPKVVMVPVKRIAAGGVWREKGGSMFAVATPVPIVVDPRIAHLGPYPVRVDGDDFNLEFRPGDFVIFVPFDAIRKAPLDEDIVEVHRQRDGLVETTIRRVRITDGRIALWPESTNPKWQGPTPYPSKNVMIVGLHAGLFRPAKL